MPVLLLVAYKNERAGNVPVQRAATQAALLPERCTVYQGSSQAGERLQPLARQTQPNPGSSLLVLVVAVR